jgi:hypothetical protein
METSVSPASLSMIRTRITFVRIFCMLESDFGRHFGDPQYRELLNTWNVIPKSVEFRSDSFDCTASNHDVLIVRRQSHRMFK